MVNTSKTETRRRIPPTILFILLVIVPALIFLLWTIDRLESISEEAALTDSQTSGERFRFSEFYYAQEGVWIVRDKGIRVQTERKYLSPSEFEQYTVHVIAPADRVEILESDARWKRVAIYNGKDKIAEGWVDANSIHQVERVKAIGDRREGDLT